MPLLRNIREYKIIESDDIKELEAKVTSFLKGGWECVGGVAVSTTQFEDERKGYIKQHYWFYQTLIREK